MPCAPTHWYRYGPAGDQPVVDEVFNAAGQSVENLWLLGDHQNTIRDVVDDTGVVRKHVDYDSAGRVTGEQTYGAAVDQLFYYTGQERDAATGLQLHGHRWYDPAIGRWLSEDPSSLGSDANLYRYVGNSYPNYTDSTGLTQAGNPLDTLFGGYSGNQVAAYVAPNPYAASLASSLSPIITQPRPTSSPSVGIGTLGSALGNASFNAGASYVSPGTKAAIGTLNVASSIALTGGFFGDTYDAITGYPRGVKDSIDRSFKSAYNGVAYALEHPSGALGSVASGVEKRASYGSRLHYRMGPRVQAESKPSKHREQVRRPTTRVQSTEGRQCLRPGESNWRLRWHRGANVLACRKPSTWNTYSIGSSATGYNRRCCSKYILFNEPRAVNGRYRDSCRYLGNEEGNNKARLSRLVSPSTDTHKVFSTAIN